jgi:spermidine/putrescine transport system ATP-binding protein
VTLNDPPDLAIEGLSKSFGDIRAVAGVSLRVEHGEFYSLLGPSGCGKTTTLRLVAGFEAPDEGRIELAGVDITTLPPNKRRVNTVFQHYALFPHLTVEENVAYGLKQERRSKDEMARRLDQTLTTVRLGELRTRRPRQLSGGQQQRVALARALIKEPTVLLLDEPLAALDLKLRKAMQLELKKLQERVGITFVYVTHDQEEALTLSDRIAVMNDGKLLQEGTPVDIYERPKTRFVADFIGQTNFLSGVVEDSGAPVLVREDATGVMLRCTTGEPVSVGSRVTVAVRPERVYPVERADIANAVQGRLTASTYLGDLVQYEIAVGSATLTLQRQNEPDDPARSWSVGDLVRVGWDENSALVLMDDDSLAGEEDRRLIDVRASAS